VGGQAGEVNAPTVLNASLNFVQFWDGRAKNLTEQAAGPIHNPKEMGSNWEQVIQKLKSDFSVEAQFKAINTPINAAGITDAIVEYEKTLITPDSPFDLYLKGKSDALTQKQVNGYRKFQSNGCTSCHQGTNLGGNLFQTFGVAGDYFKDRGGQLSSDAGRFSVTQNPEDMHVFRVPSLRNVAMTAPYFHDGSARNLKDAISIMGKYQLGRDLPKQDVEDIASFLESLTAPLPENFKDVR
jgi:cytochrome c peroxidase